MSLTVTRERKLSDSHVVTPSAPLRQLRRNGGCANVAERRQPSSAGANVAVAPKLPSSSSSLLSWSSSGQSCKNVPTVPTSWCYFFWPVLIFGKSTRKTGKHTRKQAKTRENRRKTGAFLVLIFLGEKLVDANFYAFCNYG